MDSKGPAPAPGERKQEQPDAEIDLDHLSQHHEEDRGAGLGHGLLGEGGVALVTIQDHLPDRRVLEPPLDAEEAAPGHPWPVASDLAHAHHQLLGNALDLGPHQLLIGDPGPEHH